MCEVTAKRLAKKYFNKSRLSRTTRSDVLERSSYKNGFRPYFMTGSYFYWGHWKDDAYHGTGRLVEKKRDPLLYEGEFKNGRKHGLGSIYRILPDQFRILLYDGQFVRGVPMGKGHIHSDKGGYDYFGEVKNGKMDGYGKAFYKDGSIYLGYWRQNKKEGLGYCIYSNDDCFEGRWFEDKPHGFGVYFFFRKGLAQEGVWVEGVCRTSTTRIIEYRQAAREPIVFPVPQIFLFEWEYLSDEWAREANNEAYNIKIAKLKQRKCK